MSVKKLVMTTALVLICATGVAETPQLAGAVLPFTSPICCAANRDKTGTIMSRQNDSGSQMVEVKPFTSRASFTAEGKGFEPSTGCPAPDFESGR
jgi:hypothetical protein